MSTKMKVFLTRCPVGSATEIAVQKGWLFDEFRKMGVDLAPLQDAFPEQWGAHFTHAHPALFRDGGNIAPLWARSEGADTRVIGMNFNDRKSSIIVRSDAPYRTLEDLKGKRFALPVRRGDGIDVCRAATLKGIHSALKSVGLSRNDVQFIGLEVPVSSLASSKAEAYGDSVFSTDNRNIYQTAEIQALLEKKVDAVWTCGARSVRLVLNGVVRNVFSFHENMVSDRINTEYPSTITVSGKLAREHPEIIVAYLRTLVRASEWAKENYQETTSIFAKGSWLDDVQGERWARPSDYHLFLRPELSEMAIAALEAEKEFLLGNGFIAKNFNVREWVDDSFLNEVVPSVKKLIA